MIGSISGSIVSIPQPQAPYNAAQAAVRHVAASFAVEWACAHIVIPGLAKILDAVLHGEREGKVYHIFPNFQPLFLSEAQLATDTVLATSRPISGAEAKDIMKLRALDEVR
jgi:NAD(P)-dependent dehydrogenase (short-subunit alcohol dehydrogenase family)